MRGFYARRAPVYPGVMVRLATVVLALVLATACSSEMQAPCTSPTSCACPANSSCPVNPDDCGPTGCHYVCGAASTCTGRCGTGCSVTCQDESSCDVGVATGGTVSCGRLTDCHVTCPQDCTVTCADGANCTLRCATDTELHRFTVSASCL